MSCERAGHSGVFIEPPAESFSKIPRPLNVPLVRMLPVQATREPERAPCVEAAAPAKVRPQAQVQPL